MSPLLLRRYRAERLLRHEFEGLRSRVLVIVRGRLSSCGVHLDGADLDDCYASAWQGLYAAVLSGEQIDSPTGWLVLVTFRRAIDVHRTRRRNARRRLHRNGTGAHEAVDPDFAEQIDDRDNLRHLFEGLRGRLSDRECRAASLCYLQGLSRAQAAEHLGISEPRMHKLMEGTAKRPGVATKVGGLLATINSGRWCEEQSSLMRGLAFGILDPDGERYRLAELHRRGCPACRAYVTSLRGLASVLPPVALPWGLGLGALGGTGAGAGVGTGAGASAGVGATGGASAGSLSGSGLAGVGGAAGGSWLLAGGPVGAKLAVGCVMALGFGAGCVALTDNTHHRSHSSHRSELDADSRGSRAGATGALATAASKSLSGLPGGTGASTARQPEAAAGGSSAAGQANQEFGPEQPTARAASSGAHATASARSASVSSSNSDRSSTIESRSRGSGKASPGTSPGSSPSPSSAQREFGVG